MLAPLVAPTTAGGTPGGCAGRFGTAPPTSSAVASGWAGLGSGRREVVADEAGWLEGWDVDGALLGPARCWRLLVQDATPTTASATTATVNPRTARC
jgi:hypothetical protein